MHKLIEKSNFSHSYGKSLLWIYLILSQYAEGFLPISNWNWEKRYEGQSVSKQKKTFKRTNKYSYHHRKKA